MAHPKRKISRTRRDKRRTHQKLSMVYLTTCPTTGKLHLPHRAFWQDGKLYYRGKVVMEKRQISEA
ncbi:MAG: 50S ribosomal protein L32 [Bacteroidota bacterium]